MELLPFILEKLGLWALVFAAIFLGWLGYYRGIVTAETNRKRVIGWLLQDTYAKRYRSLLTKCIDWLDKVLSKTGTGRGD